MTIEEYFKEVKTLNSIYDCFVIPIVEYLERKRAFNRLPVGLDNIRNREDAFEYIDDFNNKVTNLSNYRASYLDERAPRIDHLCINFE